jgi:negative regulator of flagellin synthesis FlgM
MKIGPPVDPSAAAALAQSRAAPAATGQAAGTPGGAEASAQVELSNTAATLRSGVAHAASEFDTDKVRRISQAIAEGTFSINPGAIADKLIANAQELLSKATR